jgi:tRNA pseudouridine38-40 synthase
MSLDDILDYCARYLPDDIIVKEAVEMEDNFHARYRVKSKTYIYKIANGRFYDVFQRKYSWHIPETLNLESMRIASKFLIGTHDFQSFTSLKSKKKSTVRKIYDIAIVNSVDIVEITVKGDGFLHNMVRIIIGTLVEVGLKRLNPESMVSIMEKKERAFAGPTAPPHGLFLKEIEY